MRQLLGVKRAPAGHWVGDGFPVRSLFTPADSVHLSPFLLLDYAAPHRFEPATRPRGVGVHPHRGFETVTMVFQGEVAHRDSAGHGGVIGAGDVQWMTAADGILHEEFHSEAFTRSGGGFEFAQLWVNLPAKDKRARPGYQSILAADIPTVTLPDGAGSVRVVAGAFDGAKGPARTFTPINVWDVDLAGRLRFAVPEGHNLAAVAISGEVEAERGVRVQPAEVAVFDRHGGEVSLESRTPSRLLVLSGEPINEPVASYGPFVMNTQDEIRQAIGDFQSGRFGELAA